jgi:2-polyprenyl-3-methyl-5-hydroxy-6-metoxy-1,4-benzoquinol methylase
MRAYPGDERAVSVRIFGSLAELEQFVAETNVTMSDEGTRMGVLANAYLADPSMTNMPDDPFSADYFDAVKCIYSRISGNKNYDSAKHELSNINIRDTVLQPAAYQNDGNFLGDYLESYGHVIKKLDVAKGARVLEYGCGDGQILLHLAQPGCDVTGVDIDAKYLEVIQQRANSLGVSSTTVHGDFVDDVDLGKFDRILFYQSFHHCLEHQRLLKRLHGMLRDGGFVVLGAEPVIDPEGPWQHVVGRSGVWDQAAAWGKLFAE